MKFTKMHGIGNDYIYFNCFEENISDPKSLAIKLSDRHYGVGGDGIILICPSDVADFKMRMFNSDGSESEMCGNGIRCVGKYVYDRKLTDKKIVTIEIKTGINTLFLNVDNGVVSSVRVDMGAPILEAAKVPVKTDLPEFINQPVSADGADYYMTCVSMGNPHAIAFVDDFSAIDLTHIGPILENHEIFPERANIEFVQVIDKNTLKMHVWERGSGITLACGTGACACLVAAVLNEKSDRTATVILPGGDLFIEWDEKDNHVYMTGAAEFVFDGEIL